jgi:hypothetical protein
VALCDGLRRVPSRMFSLGLEFIEPGPAFQVNPDPNTDPDPIWIKGFDDQKVKKKKIQLKLVFLFLIKITLYYL